MRYRDIRDSLSTGDIVLFSGKGNISAGIKWFQMVMKARNGSAKWSHVGMVIKDPDWDMVLLWESTTIGTSYDIDFKKKRRGVQLVSLSDRINNTNGEVAVRHLSKPLGAQKVGRLMRLRQKFRGLPYERDVLELFKSAYDSFAGENKEDLSSLFCSEMVAEGLQGVGLLPEGQPSNEYTPADFATGGMADSLMAIETNGEYSLGRELYVEGD